MSRTEPCPTCPWRKSSTVGGFDIPGFSIDLMRGLSNTVGPGDDFRPIMACHYSPEACGSERPCIGYVAQVGYTNLSVRIMAIEGRIDLRAIWAVAEALDLWESFEEMLEAYEAAAPE